MRTLLLTIILFSSSAFAGLKQLGVKNLSLEYTSPKGVGSVEKIEIGLSKSINHPLEVEKIEGTLVVRTPVLDFTWHEAWKFLLDADSISLLNANLNAGKGKHDLSVDQAKLVLGGEFNLRKAVAHCEGSSELPDLEYQLMEDCRESMKVEADRLDIPLDGFLIDILSRIPVPDEEQPLKNFTLSVKQGDFYAYFLASYVVKAGLRTWGAFHYEDELKSMVIRIDLIKFGILPVTGIVMKELKERIKDPRIKVEPPFIRIRMRE
ncbi:MAG: hypothetical protein V4598_01990 [Bdellovibrionota bacterium]